MQIGEFLIDLEREEKRFKIQSFLHDGDAYQIALAEDTTMGDIQVCVKTINYDTQRIGDEKYISLRREALKEELKFLALSSHLLPEALDWIVVENGEGALSKEPILVYEYQRGETLYDYIIERFPKGVKPQRALRILGELAVFLQEIHQHKYVFRDLDPRHIIIGIDDIFHMVGCGNAVSTENKLNPEKRNTNPAYTAPEIRDEISGAFLKPASDCYSLGALFSFLLTGIEVREKTESPLTRKAYDRLKSLEEGYQLLVARMMMPMGKHRFTRMSKLLPYLSPETLPNTEDKGFDITLPKPWKGSEAGNRAANSSLSAGPLISVDPEREAFIKSKLVPDLVPNTIKNDNKNDLDIAKNFGESETEILHTEESSETEILDVNEKSDAELLDLKEESSAQTEHEKVVSEKSAAEEIAEEEKPEIPIVSAFPFWLIFLAIILVLSAAGLVVFSTL